MSIFLVWLHLSCGVSHENCGTARDFILTIVQAAQRLPVAPLPAKLFAKDIRTNIKELQLTPDLKKTVVCPTCFHLYPSKDVPSNCTYKEVKGVKVCDEPLFITKTNYHGISDKGACHLQPYRLDSTKLLVNVEVPRTTYVTQEIESWLTWFLNKKDVEKDIEDWALLVCEKTQKAPSVIEDIQQTKAWSSLQWPSVAPSIPDTSPDLNLAFNLFIDWFNPLGNKQAGKSHSMGLMAINCLNLPPNSRNRLKNCCIAGITPGTHESSVTTTNHLLSPIIDQLLTLSDSVNIRTKKHPEGRLVRVKLLGLIGDVVATHKVAGYASHSATRFCSWCTCEVSERHQMRCGRAREDLMVREQAKAWEAAKTISQKDKLVRNYGV